MERLGRQNGMIKDLYVLEVAKNTLGILYGMDGGLEARAEGRRLSDGKARINETKTNFCLIAEIK